MAADHVPALVEAVVGVWEEHRMGRESLADTVERIGLRVVVDALRGLPAVAWAAGDEEPGENRALTLAVAR